MLPKKLRTPLQSFPRSSKVIAKTKNFTMKYAANNLPHNRGGVVISRSVGKAVERNRLRRVIMNFLSSNPNFLKGGTGRDFVFFVGSKAATEKQTNLSKELKTYGQLF